jgi:aryl-alcohol dehydrogenase-like predicted oxidoreductase
VRIARSRDGYHRNVETRRIGSLGVSAVGLGCNNFGGRLGEAATRAVVDAALDAGITFFDTADNYGDGRSEEFLGRILEGRRDRVVLATKFGGMRLCLGREGGASPGYVREAVEASLRRLGTDRIDLYQLHLPDPGTPIADTLGALDELVRAGTVREIGCSNFDAARLREADAAARPGAARFASVQNQLSLLNLADADDGLPEAERLGLAYIPFFPLASGMLTGKVRRGVPVPAGTRVAGWPAERTAELLTEVTFDRIEALTAFAEERGHSLLELAFAWLLSQRPVVSVIAGATSPAQVRANAAAGSWRLDPADLEALTDELARLHAT